MPTLPGFAALIEGGSATTEEASVRPYPWSTGTPSSLSARAEILAGSRSPPERMQRMEEESVAPRETAPIISAIIVGTAVAIVTSACLMASIEDSTGMNEVSIACRVAFTSGSSAPHRNLKTFELGSAFRKTSSSLSMSICSTQPSMQYSRLSCVSGTAFGSPVVPEV
ncbi:hypothetical protein SDC9_173145 [bioreactor metagenome]|uniref:Uncharacterized protein n=1 Tax=bioreactor metagenome TaxID=1076179 RepID=A0A645GHT9_9ZZZZ